MGFFVLVKELLPDSVMVARDSLKVLAKVRPLLGQLEFVGDYVRKEKKMIALRYKRLPTDY